jgi:glycosyltransferase involved in cell wall biosynthesis
LSAPRHPLRIFVPSAAALLTDHRGHGEGLIAWNLFAGLAARGHELVVCARRVELEQDPPFEVVETGPASRWESIEPLAYSRVVTRVFERRHRRRPFDLAHWLFPQGAAEVLFSNSAVPLVIGPHSLAWPSSCAPRRPGDLVRHMSAPLFGRLHRRALASAAAILVSVREATATVPEEFRSKVRVLPFGIDTAAFELAPLPSTATVLFVGRLDAEKGVRELVEAFADVTARISEARLVDVGDGPERAWLEARRHASGLNGSLELLGPVPHSRIADVMKEASLLCLPSRGEPFGMVALEAMASGRPVVAFDLGGPRYLIDHGRGGYLVRPGDRDGLVDSLVQLLGDRRRLEEMGRYNRRKVEAELSWEKVLDALEEVYADAVGRFSSGG